MTAQYAAALPSVKSALSVHQQAVIEASKLTASAADLAAPSPVAPVTASQERRNEEKQLLVARAEQLLSLAELDQTAATPVHLLQPGDALASTLHAVKSRHPSSLQQLSKQLRAQISTLYVGDSDKVHLVAALKLCLFALEADTLADGVSLVHRTDLVLGQLQPLSQLEWLHRFVESYFLHQLGRVSGWGRQLRGLAWLCSLARSAVCSLHVYRRQSQASYWRLSSLTLAHAWRCGTSVLALTHSILSAVNTRNVHAADEKSTRDDALGGCRVGTTAASHVTTQRQSGKEEQLRASQCGLADACATKS